MSIGNNISLIRKSKKLTQADLAKEIGISRSYLSDLENDRKNPSAKTLKNLAEKLSVPLIYLLQDETQSSKDNVDRNPYTPLNTAIETYANKEIQSDKSSLENFNNIMHDEIGEMLNANLADFMVENDDFNTLAPFKQFLEQFINQLESFDNLIKNESISVSHEELKHLFYLQDSINDKFNQLFSELHFMDSLTSEEAQRSTSKSK